MELNRFGFRLRTQTASREQTKLAFKYLDVGRAEVLDIIATSTFESFYEKRSEVPMVPFPKVRDAWHQIGWDEDEDEDETGEADETALAMKELLRQPQCHEKDLKRRCTNLRTSERG